MQRFMLTAFMFSCLVAPVFAAGHAVFDPTQTICPESTVVSGEAKAGLKIQCAAHCKKCNSTLGGCVFADKSPPLSCSCDCTK